MKTTAVGGHVKTSFWTSLVKLQVLVIEFFHEDIVFISFHIDKYDAFTQMQCVVTIFLFNTAEHKFKPTLNLKKKQKNKGLNSLRCPRHEYYGTFEIINILCMATREC